MERPPGGDSGGPFLCPTGTLLVTNFAAEWSHQAGWRDIAGHRSSPAPGEEFADRLTVCAETYLFDTVAHMAIWDRLVELAAEQHGYVTTRDAREIGVDPVQLRLLTARGRLERVGRGVYRVPVLPRGEHDDLAAAVAWTLGRGAISHESALALHGLAAVDPSRIHLTVPRDNHPRAAGGELYRLHRRDLRATDITSVDAIPVTTVARTIKDCLDTGTDPYQLRTAIERAEADGTLRRSPAAELRAALDERATGLHAPTKEAAT